MPGRTKIRDDTPPAPGCVGIDLAGVEHRETGVAVLRAGRLVRLTAAATDAEILALAELAGPGGTVAINAPLSRPLGRCCLDDDCPCRVDPGTRSRRLERDLGRMGVPTLATALIKVLARRGIRLAEALRAAGVEPLEVYPFATLKLLGLPTAGKKTTIGRRAIYRALRPLVPGLRHPRASEHQLDAVVCALTAQLWREGRTVAVGDPAEGRMIVPDVGRHAPEPGPGEPEGRETCPPGAGRVSLEGQGAAPARASRVRGRPRSPGAGPDPCIEPSPTTG